MDFTLPRGGPGMYLRDFQGRTLEGIQAAANQVAVVFEGNGIDKGLTLVISADGDHIHIVGIERPVHPNSMGHKIYFPCEKQRNLEPVRLFEPMLPSGDPRRN